MEPLGRETFGRNILMGHLKLKVKDVLCLQGNPMEKGFDVTLYLEEKHNEIMKTVTEGIRRRSPVSLHGDQPGKKQLKGGHRNHVQSAREGRRSEGLSGEVHGQCLLSEVPQGLPGFLEWEERLPGVTQGVPEECGWLPPSSGNVLPGG
jgi:hypothetical protein